MPRIHKEENGRRQSREPLRSQRGRGDVPLIDSKQEVPRGSEASDTSGREGAELDGDSDVASGGEARGV